MGASAPGQDRPRDVFTPMSLSIDCRVPAKLKAKIWAHEYFDFGLLLANSPTEPQYGEVVRNLVARGANWRYYDTNFRYLKQQQLASLAWNEVHWELWIRSQNLSTTKPPRPSNGGGGGG